MQIVVGFYNNEYLIPWWDANIRSLIGILGRGIIVLLFKELTFGSDLIVNYYVT